MSAKRGSAAVDQFLAMVAAGYRKLSERDRLIVIGAGRELLESRRRVLRQASKKRRAANREEDK